MMDHPEVLKKAQQEIDAVVGQDRLPTFKDRASLPYGGTSLYAIAVDHTDSPLVDAILEETWRWGVPVPLSK
jgi:cytochrome P450